MSDMKSDEDSMEKLDTSFDILFLIDSSSSMTVFLEKIQKKIIPAIARIAEVKNGNFRFGLIEFQSIGSYPIRTFPFRFDINRFVSDMQDNPIDSDDLPRRMSIEEAFTSALSFDWRSNKSYTSEIFHENLVICFTNQPPMGLFENINSPASPDLWNIVNVFNGRNIHLAMVGSEPEVNLCSDFYCALSQKTGAQYIPLVNAKTVLSKVICRVFDKEDTLSQAFRSLDMKFDIELGSSFNYRHDHERIRFMIEECKNMKDIRKNCYNYFRSSNTHNLSDQDQNGSQDHYYNNDNHDHGNHHGSQGAFGIGLLNIDIIDDLWNKVYPDLIVSPTSSDEGYRTRLPTVASFNENMGYAVSSPCSVSFLNQDDYSDYDDALL